EKGKTPIVVNLSRKDNHFVKIEMTGYLPYETTFTRSTSGWIWGNLVFGGVIGLIVDSMTGAVYKLTPTEVNAVLQSGKISSLSKKNSLYVAVVLNPDPKWEKVGQLKKIN
ncbi:MAG: PEGA domain-containing protein, partial [Candidatus Omnitrophota bacterium]